MVKIKGNTMLDTVKSSKQVYGEQEYERLLILLDPEAKKVFQEGIVASEWYALDVYTNLLEIIIKQKHKGNYAILVKGSENQVEKQLRGIYSPFVKLGSPEYFIKKVASFNQTIFQGVTVETKSIGPGKMLIRYLGFQKQHSVFEYVLLGFYQKGLELCGAKNVKSQFTTSIAAGKGYSELMITWEPKLLFG